MPFKTRAGLVIALLLTASLLQVTAMDLRAQDASITPPTGIANIGNDQFASATPVMTFIDMYTRQPWGRYVVSETVTVPKYEYKEVKETVFVPSWSTEPRTTTTTQYEQLVTYQPQMRTVPSLNPFAAPQQVLEYVPFVQYQPRNVQQTQMLTFPKYEQREISRMIPVLVNSSEQRARFVDRPLNNQPNSNNPLANNPYQQAAMVSQANRNVSSIPTYPIDSYFGYNGYANNAPYRFGQVLPPANPAPTYAATPYAVTPYAATPTSYANGAGGYPIAYGSPMYAANGYANAGVAYPQPTYAAANSRPLFDLSRLTSSTGSLFRGGLFNSNRNGTPYTSPASTGSPIYAAMPASSNPAYAGNPTYTGNTPYVAWNTSGVASNQPNYWSPAQNNGITFRPSTAPYQGSYSPTMSPAGSSIYRDPNQLGMPATVLR